MNFEQLVRAAAVGDERAWNRISERLGPKLNRWFELRYERLDAADLTQDTYIVIWTKLRDFEVRSEAAFMSWVYSIARFVALAALRQWERRQKIALAKGQASPTPRPRQSTLLDRAERLEQVMREVERLPKSYQLAVENILERGNSKKLAKIVGLSWGGARSLERRTFKELRRRLRSCTPT